MTDTTPAEFSDDDLAFIETIFEHARSGETAELAAIFQRGYPTDLANARGDTALILAAYHQHLETVELLLELGTDTSAVNSNGQTALVAAVFRNNEPIVSALLAAGADPSLGAHTAQAVAQQFGLTAMQELLG